MDTPRFDRWTRNLATAGSRRSVLSLLLAGALAGTVGPEGIAQGKGKGKGGGKGGGKKKGCTKSEKKCGKKCIPQSHCCMEDDDACPLHCLGEVCQPDGSCRCNPGTIQFNGVCGFRPKCLNAGNFNGNGPADCCSGEAIFAVDEDSGISAWVCLPGKKNCLTDVDCVTGILGRCKGWMCPEMLAQVTQGRCPHLN